MSNRPEKLEDSAVVDLLWILDHTYWHGELAADRGQTEAMNPNPEHGLEWRAWRRGWRDVTERKRKPL